MAKNKTVFVCQECGYESPGWLGKCPACNNWNSLIEENVVIKTSRGLSSTSSVKPLKINSIEVDTHERYSTGMKELDRVLGGGIVRGSLILIGGDPGIGKSTLIIQICETLKNDGNVIYVSGEESTGQIKLRAERLNIKNEKLSIVSETDFSVIESIIDTENPSVVVIDSIQTMFISDISSAPGSVSQVRDVTGRLMRIAKSRNISIIVIGHVTKEGAIAGPRVLEHMVDTVLYFEGERHMSYRILRAVKNRFGSTNEIGIFEMGEKGLVEVDNPSQMMLNGRPVDVPGSVVTATLEGTRPMLIEVQALVCNTSFGMPRRMATGVDYNRITMLTAVLEKKVGFIMHNYDAYVNVVGGMKIDEPACDLAFVVALASSFKNAAISSNTIVIGEVGLTGEIRAVNNVEKRIMEACRIGFKNCIIPQANSKSVKGVKGLDDIKIETVSNVREALEIVLNL